MKFNLGIASLPHLYSKGEFPFQLKFQPQRIDTETFVNMAIPLYLLMWMQTRNPDDSERFTYLLNCLQARKSKHQHDHTTLIWASTGGECATCAVSITRICTVLVDSVGLHIGTATAMDRPVTSGQMRHSTQGGSSTYVCSHRDLRRCRLFTQHVINSRHSETPTISARHRKAGLFNDNQTLVNRVWVWLSECTFIISRYI